LAGLAAGASFVSAGQADVEPAVAGERGGGDRLPVSSARTGPRSLVRLAGVALDRLQWTARQPDDERTVQCGAAIAPLGRLAGAAQRLVVCGRGAAGI